MIALKRQIQSISIKKEQKRTGRELKKVSELKTKFPLRIRDIALRLSSDSDGAGSAFIEAKPVTQFDKIIKLVDLSQRQLIAGHLYNQSQQYINDCLKTIQNMTHQVQTTALELVDTMRMKLDEMHRNQSLLDKPNITDFIRMLGITQEDQNANPQHTSLPLVEAFFDRLCKGVNEWHEKTSTAYKNIFEPHLETSPAYE